MSCDAAAFAAFLFFASTGGPAEPARQFAAVEAPLPVAGEPLFADIVTRAGRLRSVVDQFRQVLNGGETTVTLPGFSAFKSDIAALAALDMQGHETLKARNLDGDLKCILRGISQDLPLKLNDIETAATGRAQDKALRDMRYLLNDNVEVITAPPAPPV